MTGYCHICKIAYEREHPRCLVVPLRPYTLNTIIMAGLNELAIALGRMGIDSGGFAIAPGFVAAFRVELHARTFKSVAMGTTLAVTFDDAFTRVMHRSAHEGE